MKTKFFLSLAALVLLPLGSPAFAAGAKSYQVTGTILEVTPTMVVVEKGGDRWEIDLDPQVKGRGDLKVGDKITITYVMSATKLDTGDASTSRVAPESKR